MITLLCRKLFFFYIYRASYNFMTQYKFVRNSNNMGTKPASWAVWTSWSLWTQAANNNTRTRTLRALCYEDQPHSKLYYDNCVTTEPKSRSPVLSVS